MNHLALPSRPLRHKRRALAVVALVCVPLALAGVVRWLIDPVAFANRHVERLERVALAVLDQRLTIGSLEGHLYPELDVIVHDVVLASKVPGDEPMLVLPSIQIRFQLRRALVTFGRELPLEAVRIEGGVLRVRRDRDGHIDVLDVIKKLPKLDPRDLEGGVLSAFSIDDAQLRLIDDRLEGHELVINDLHVATQGRVALGEPLSASATAAWADEARPASASLRMDRVPEDLALWPPPPAMLRVELPQTDLVNALEWLELPGLFAEGVADVSIDVATTPAAITGTLDVQGTGVSAIVTTGAGAGAEANGEQGIASLRTDVRVAVDGVRTELDNFAFAGAGIGIEGNAVFRQASLEGIESIDVLVRADELARLGLLIPPLRNTAPGALRLSGSGTGALHASANDLTLDLDLDGARVVIGEALSKRAGDRLRLSLKGTRDSLTSKVGAAGGAPSSPGRIDTALQVDLPRGVRIAGGLVFQPRGVDIALFDLKTNRTTLARAAALSPVLRDMVDGSVRGGSLAVGLHARMTANDSEFHFALNGRDLQIDVDRTSVTGDALVKIAALTDARGLRLRVGAQLAGLAIETRDASGKLVFEKPAASPLVVHASLVEVGGPGSLGRALENLDASSQEMAAVFVGNGMSPRWRKIALGMNGSGSVRAAHATLMGVALDDADVRLTLRNGKLKLEPAIVSLFSGRASVAQSVVDLRAVPATWSLALEVEDIDLAKVLEPIHVITGDVTGRAAVHAKLRATGLSLESLLSSLDGPVTVFTHDVGIAAVDALSQSIESVWRLIEKVPGVTRAEIDQARGPPLSEALREGEWSALFRGNQFRLDKPMITRTSVGVLTLSGHAALDGSVAMGARLDLEAGAATVPVEATVTGTWTNPVFATTNFDRLWDAARTAFEAWLGITPAPGHVVQPEPVAR